MLSPERQIAANCRTVYQQMWANNGDTLSRQYAGTAALKVFITRFMIQTHTSSKCCTSPPPVDQICAMMIVSTITATVLRPFFRDHPGEPVPEENFWSLWCKGRLTEADTPTIRLSATPSGVTSAHLHHPPCFLQSLCPSCHPTNSIKALKALCQSIVCRIRGKIIRTVLCCV